MRIRLTLIPHRNTVLPINYGYFLTGIIYSFLSQASENYSRFLHDEGYHLDDSRAFKLFTFSMLQARSFRIRGDSIFFPSHVTGAQQPRDGSPSNRISWYITSPVQEFIQHLVSGIFAEGQTIHVGPQESTAAFSIEHVETLAPPSFTECMDLTCLAPITISKPSESPAPAGKKSYCRYLRPWEEGFSEAVGNNLARKYRLMHDRQPPDGPFTLIPDAEYVAKKRGRITKKISFKGTDIIGFMAPCAVTGPPALIEVGYETGFGDKNSLGFGMVKEIAS